MDEHVVQRFKTECEHAFSFLVEDYGFERASLETAEDIAFATVTFMARNLALECIYDERESFIELKIARVEKGIKASDYAVDARGRKVRKRLLSLLLERGVRALGLKEEKLAARPVDEMFRIKLKAYAELLRVYGEDILRDSPSVFDE